MDSPRIFLDGSTVSPLMTLAKNRLVWLPELGIGYLDAPDPYAIYDASYFESYVERADTDIGRALTDARVELVRKYHDGPVVDVGVGSGQFVDAYGEKAVGYDVNPVAVRWLRDRKKYRDIYAVGASGGRFPAMCFWDALEHIPDPAAAVALASRYVFVSLPIFEGAKQCLKSKHFKPGEHIWYFEDRGIREWFRLHGFEFVEYSDIESRLGREGIGSYVFKRKGV